MNKATVTLGGQPLAGTQAIAWKFVSGVTPYSTTVSVHTSVWPKLRPFKGKPLVLQITDSRGVTVTVNDVYILHEAPSDSPHRASFVIADKRWLWPYKLVVRDYNMPRKTGDRTALNPVPVELQTVVDRYDFLPYSLDQGRRWTAQRTVEDVLDILESTGRGRNRERSWEVDSWPIKDTSGAGTSGQFTVQNVTLRDPGDVALARLLSYIPGADVYVDARGKVVIYDASDLDAVEDHFRSLPVATYTGEAAAWIDRKMIRPERVLVHYQREVECLFKYSDDYRGFTSASPNRNEAYLENVIPTVDTETVVSEYDPETNQTRQKTVPPGTWVRVDNWLRAMDAVRPADSFPWTFDTIKRHWHKGDLDGVLGARGLDLDRTANVAARVQALKQHFRQTFRINRRVMERVRDLLSVRVALLDPVTGARAPAAVWGQACVIPSRKDYMTSRAGDPDKVKVYRNVDYLAPSDAGAQIIQTSPGPTAVNILDRELGVFRLEWVASPYGLTEAFVPCHLVEERDTTTAAVITRDLAQQDEKAVGAGMKVEAGTNGIFLRDTLRFAVLMTIIPSAPNNERQFHRVAVKPDQVQDLFRREFRIQDGEGPDLEVFVPPGEATARFAWTNDQQAYLTVQDLLGLVGDDQPGIEGNELAGFTLSNEQRHLTDHAVSLAAELLVDYADNVQGQVVTRVPERGLKLVGNMAGAMVRVAVAPSAKVDAVHQFPGQQRQVSRLAVMPEAARQIILGIVPFKE